MAGDWIKIEHDLPDKPEVMEMAVALEIEADSVVGKLIRVWRWYDNHTPDGNAPVTVRGLLDRLAGVAHFIKAMEDVGWMREENGRLILSKFDRHNGKTAKVRALGRNRTQLSRAKSNGGGVTDALPEKRIEEKKVDADASTAATPERARILCLAHPSQAETRPALEAAMKSLHKHPFEKVLAGTKAYAAAVMGWTDAERLQFVKKPEAFFNEDTWNQPAENWRSRIKARQAGAAVDLEAAKKSLGRRAAHIS